MGTTIRDVARLAGTSVAAVSVTLNARGRQKSRIGAATQERIRAAAQQLGYRPNRLAQSLVTGRTGVLGLVFPYARAFIDHNPFCMQIMTGVCEEVVRDHFNLMLHTAAGDDWNAAEAHQLLDSRVDGLLLVVPAPRSPVVAACRDACVPYVAVVYEPDNEDIYSVNLNERDGGRLATRHLIERGHRRIAHLRGGPQVASSEPRCQGYLDALEEAGIARDPDLVVPSGYNWEAGYEATCRLLDLPPDRRPTALFAVNDLCAEGVLRALRSRGISVPGDMAVVGFDDTWFAAMTEPPLTSVHAPITEMGALAAQMLIDQVEGRDRAECRRTLPVSLTVRASTGAPLPQNWGSGGNASTGA